MQYHYAIFAIIYAEKSPCWVYRMAIFAHFLCFCCYFLSFFVDFLYCIAIAIPVQLMDVPSTISHRIMLMYSKEANNRKQEIDRQHHTIPNQRANDKHHGNVYNLLFRYGKVRSQNMEKLKCSFPTFCKRTFPQLHKIASYAHYAQCRLLRKPSHFIIYSRK